MKKLDEQELKQIIRFAQMSDPLPGTDLWIMQASEYLHLLVHQIRNQTCCTSPQSNLSSEASGLQDSPALLATSEDASSP